MDWTSILELLWMNKKGKQNLEWNLSLEQDLNKKAPWKWILSLKLDSCNGLDS
jgi:hypothetical protein